MSTLAPPIDQSPGARARDLLLVLPGFRAGLEIKEAVRLTLVGALPQASALPVLESAVASVSLTPAFPFPLAAVTALHSSLNFLTISAVSVDAIGWRDM